MEHELQRQFPDSQQLHHRSVSCDKGQCQQSVVQLVHREHGVIYLHPAWILQSQRFGSVFSGTSAHGRYNPFCWLVRDYDGSPKRHNSFRIGNWAVGEHHRNGCSRRLQPLWDGHDPSDDCQPHFYRNAYRSGSDGHRDAHHQHDGWTVLRT